MNVGDLCSVFVYGTLQRGECRDSCWPFPPGRVERARIRAQLFDLGEYPAIVLGDDWVLGECWQFAPAEMARTLSILDDIEGYSGSPDDLYCRQVVEFERLDAEAEQEGQAYAYFFAQPHRLLQIGRRILPVDGVCCWPG